MDSLKNEIIDTEVYKILRLNPQIKIRNLESNELHNHYIKGPFSLVLEKFDPAQQIIDVEIISEEWQQHIVLKNKEYQLFIKPTLHSHDHLELMIVLSGSISNNVEGKTFTYHSGQGCLMNRHIRHQEVPNGNADVLFITLSREFLESLFDVMKREKTALRGSTLPGFLSDVLNQRNDGNFLKSYIEFSPCGEINALETGYGLLCNNALEAMRMKTPGCGFLTRAAILSLLNDLGDASLYSLQRTSSTLSSQEFLTSKIDLLIRASHGAIRIQELEERLGYNGDYLNRLYRKQKGLTISDACQDARIQAAKYLLRHTDTTIDEIMDTLNITSRGSFFAKFRQAEGMTPREYRRTYAEDKKHPL